MVVTASSDTFEKPDPPNEWTVVKYRRGKRGSQKIIQDLENQTGGAPGRIQALNPVDTTNDPERESRLMQKMHTFIEKLESSKFYIAFLDQMQSRAMSDLFSKVLGSEEKMVVVIYGIGSIESFENPRSQLALAMLMKKNFPWIGDVEVYDPVISAVESKVMTDLGCYVLSLNEEGKRQVFRPTLFFMPHCETGLYENLLQTNWDIDRLNKIALLGNSFDKYRQGLEYSMKQNKKAPSCILDAMRFTKEIIIDVSDVNHYQAFQSSSWHFFGLEYDGDLQLHQDWQPI